MRSLIVLFSTLAVLALHLEASAQQAVSPAEYPFLVIGEGSTISQNQDLHFGQTFQKNYCDGNEVVSYYDLARSVFATNCCRILIYRGEDSQADLILKSQLKNVLSFEMGSGWIELDGPYNPQIVCNHGKIITTYILEHAFGEVFRVKAVVDPRLK